MPNKKTKGKSRGKVTRNKKPMKKGVKPGFKADQSAKKKKVNKDAKWVGPESSDELLDDVELDEETHEDVVNEDDFFGDIDGDGVYPVHNN